jgi:hypothetical protein
MLSPETWLGYTMIGIVVALGMAGLMGLFFNYARKNNSRN